MAEACKYCEADLSTMDIVYIAVSYTHLRAHET